ncbi:MAG: T9SS type A sorting domain-containing protein [Bacteroidetes bacterium]|nr:T9SS type A sorting domain-containing protein [Bacteroidota bacterium]
MKSYFIITILLFSVGFNSIAQLTFPNGNTLNLNTSLNYLYLETEILFHTGTHEVDDYRWEKVIDSVDNRWLVHSCFNGDCWNDRPQTSNFVGEYGENDTTAFIRFHVWSYDIDGGLNIQYRVINNKDSLDQSLLSFHITFNGLSGVEQELNNEKSIQLYPNPVRSKLYIIQEKYAVVDYIRIFDINNKLILERSGSYEQIDISHFPSGLYMLSCKLHDQIITKKIIKAD